jgi:hypothetical protein
MSGDQAVTLTEVKCAAGVASFGLVVPPVQAGLARPQKLYAVAGPNRPAEGVAAADYLVAAGNYAAGVEVPADATDPTALSIDVPGVPPGVYFGQVILEFAD